MNRRCASATEEPSIRYHDEEWGVPVHDEHRLFEFLVLEGAQAGLSWSTILRKREAYRRAFHGFDPARVTRFGARDVRRLLADEGIRPRVGDARGDLRPIANGARLLRSPRRNDRPTQTRWRSTREVPAETEVSRAMRRGLIAGGFRFVGPTICYAFMQAVGLVNDHTVGCPRRAALAGTRRTTARQPMSLMAVTA